MRTHGNIGTNCSKFYGESMTGQSMILNSLVTTLKTVLKTSEINFNKHVLFNVLLLNI